MLPYDEATRILEVARVHLGDRVREGGEAYAGRAPASFRVHELLFAMIPFVGLLMLCGIAVVLAVGWLLGWFRAVSGAGAGRARRRVAALAAASSAPNARGVPASSGPAVGLVREALQPLARVLAEAVGRRAAAGLRHRRPPRQLGADRRDRHA
jgi:hypothetical protein